MALFSPLPFLKIKFGIPDDMVLELAVLANCQYIVTFNKRHFLTIGQFGLQAVTPGDFLDSIGVER